MKLYQNKGWLEQKYWEEELSLSKIAKACKVNVRTIWWWMKHLKIKRRNISESLCGKKHLNYGKHLSENTKEKISIAHIGMKHTEETKRKLSKIAKSQGFGKSLYGKLGDKAHSWKGGKLKSREYVYIYKPNHPYAIRGNYVAEHRLIAEKALKRCLKPSEEVHHINNNHSDNRNCNLLICTHSYHSWFHSKMAQLYMKKYFQKEEI